MAILVLRFLHFASPMILFCAAVIVTPLAHGFAAVADTPRSEIQPAD